jgi:parvulin-like peptidyl-prolyl isomerase
MAKNNNVEQAENARVSRKEVLIARRNREQNRQVYLVVGIVAAFLALILLAGIVNEYVVKPGQPAAVVNGETITIRDWQARVRYQRAQLVISVEDIVEIYGGDLNILQQVAGQQINFLLNPETLGELMLELMVDETLIRQEAERRGITVTDADLQAEIGKLFGYYGGLSPTPMPTASPTIMPTPSLTPIPTAVLTATETIETDPLPTQAPLPTSAPLPTATPVSEDSFQTEYNEVLQRLRSYGVREEVYREAIRARIYQDRLAERLADSIELITEAEHVSFFILIYETAEEAEAAQQAIGEKGYLTVWNELRSLPFDDESRGSGFASELLWRAQEDLTAMIGMETTVGAFTLPLNQPSDVYVQPGNEATGQPDRYYIIQVSGREVRPLPEFSLDEQKQENLTNWLQTQRLGGTVEISERWRGQSPRQPMIDMNILRQPAPVEIPGQ